MPPSDTDFLLASLSSLVPSITDQSMLLEALILHDGIVETAARHLTGSMSSSKKRKRTSNSLSGWLVKSPKSISTRTFARENTPETRLSPTPGNSGLSISKSAPVDLMKILKQPPKSAPPVPRLPPMTLRTPEMIAKHTPCTLHLSVLPADLACRLFYCMLEASREWKRNKWWLFDRLVESPHKTTFFARRTDGIGSDETWQTAAQYWYNGQKTLPPPTFPPEMEEACKIIEYVVNTNLLQRKRHPLEYTSADGQHQPWSANVAASNCYTGAAEGVGAHSDGLSYLGPYPTIASLSLGVARVFRLREVVPSDEAATRHAQTFNLELPHNSLIIMHAGTQEKFKHSIPPQSTIDIFHPSHPREPLLDPEPSNVRINITFRFFRPDFAPDTQPRCQCDIPMTLRPDMKGRKDKYWWTCYNVQEPGKGCGLWKVMDMKVEGRGSQS